MSEKAQTPIADGGKMYLGAGAIYFNYGEVDEAVVGATRGGSTFNANRTFRSVAQDGTYGEVKGHRRKDGVNPQLTINALELDTTNLPKLFAGMDVDTAGVDFDVLTERLNIADSDYLTNVAFVGENHKGEDIVIVLKNALGDGNLEMAIENKNEIVPSAQFTAHYDPTTPETVPYEIRLPKTV